MSKYVVTITAVGNGEESSSTICYQQTVDALDTQAVIAAVNSSPVNSPVPAREPRKRAKRSDAGKPRRKENATLIPP